MSKSGVRHRAQLQRKEPRLPVFVVIPGRLLAGWNLAGTTVIEGMANGHSFGRRTIKAWGKGSDDWFVEFTAPFCKSAGLSVGDAVVLELKLAHTSMPSELERALGANRRLHAVWSGLTARQQRDASEYVRAAKGAATRERRAAAVVTGLRERR